MSMVNASFKDPATKIIILNHLGVILRNEMSVMVSDNVGSLLRSNNMDDMKCFSWSKLVDELRVHAPTLLHLLQAMVKKKKSCNRPPADGIIGVCASILLKHHYDKMSMVQKIISVVLYSGHASKQVRK